MKNLILSFIAVLSMTSCIKEEDKMPFVTQTYGFIKNEFIGYAKSYNSDSLISDTVGFDADLLFMHSTVCYFMDSIELFSDSLATFRFDNREDSILTVKYDERNSNITFNRINETDNVPSTLYFIKNLDSMKATCTGIRFVLNQSLHTFLFFGELTSENLQSVQRSLNEGEIIYIQQFDAIYGRK